MTQLTLLRTSEKTSTLCPLSALFIALTFENYEWYFFYEILGLFKNKNTNVS